MSLLQWAETAKNGPETNYLVQKLSGKEWEDPVTEEDLPTAKQVLRDHVVVGLMDDMEESFRRFNIVMSATTDQGSERNRQESCMQELFHPEELSGMEKVVKNQNEHQTVSIFLNKLIGIMQLIKVSFIPPPSALLCIGRTRFS